MNWCTIVVFAFTMHFFPMIKIFLDSISFSNLSKCQVYFRTLLYTCFLEREKAKSCPPTPGIEPGPPGWKPGILAIRPRGIAYEKGQQHSLYYRYFPFIATNNLDSRNPSRPNISPLYKEECNVRGVVYYLFIFSNPSKIAF